MNREIEIKASPKEVAELLFELDNKEVAEVFSHWHDLFEQRYEERKAKGEPIWIFDLNHFMMYVIPEMDEKALDVVRCMFSYLVVTLIDDVEKKHLTRTFINI